MSKSNVTPNISVAPSSNSGNASMTRWSSCLDVAAGTALLDWRILQAMVGAG